MRRVIAVALLLGCGGARGPAPAGPQRTDEARDAAIAELTARISSGNVDEILGALGEEIGYGGLWFPDTTCRRQFAITGTIHGEARAIFAGCLASLRLAKSERRHAYPEVAVLTYEPGIEVEVLFDLGDDRVRFIGYAGRRGPKDALPMVTQTALDAQRIDPLPLVLDEASVAAIAQEQSTHMPRDEYPEGRVHTWFKLCINFAGEVTTVTPRFTTSLRAATAFAAIVRGWKFRPFMLGGQPTPVCSLIRVGDPQRADLALVLPAPVPEKYASATMLTSGAFGRPLRGTYVRLDEAERVLVMQTGSRQVRTELLYCITASGTVDTVDIVRSSGLPRYDARLARAVATWRYEPLVTDDGTVRACSRLVVTFKTG